MSGVFAAGAGLAQVAGAPTWLRIVLAVVAVAGAFVAAVFFRFEQISKARVRAETSAEAERVRLARVVVRRDTSNGGLASAQDLSPYDLGVDQEAVSVERDAHAVANHAYVPRDVDSQLAEAIKRARESARPAMVVLRGPSKSGKSRTLYEALRADSVLRRSAVFAPRDLSDLVGLLGKNGLPRVSGAEIVLWLDDLEQFVTSGRSGMTRTTLAELAEWPHHVIVLATAGGRGAGYLETQDLWVPMDRVVNHPDVQVLNLLNTISNDELDRVAALFPSQIADEIERHGIGEYMVAAPALARKLVEMRHDHGPPCPEGAAVVWAAIDWARVGMRGQVPKQTLRDLWELYFPQAGASDAHFERGLKWAMRPVYHSIALVSGAEALGAYDWIVSYADQVIKREIPSAMWEKVLGLSDPEQAFSVGVSAFARRRAPLSAEAFAAASHSEDAVAAAEAAYNLAVALDDRGDVAGATTAYQDAINSTNPDIAPKAALNLGYMLVKVGDYASAHAPYEYVIASGHADQMPKAWDNLGILHELEGNVELAKMAYSQAVASGHALVVPAAATRLGDLLRRTGDDAGATEAFAIAHQHVVDAGVPGANTFHYASMLEERGEIAAALNAYQATINAGDPLEAPRAAVNLGALLVERYGADPVEPRDARRAQDAYELAIAAGHPEATPKALFNLGHLLTKLNDLDGARAAYERAASSDHKAVREVAATLLASLDP